MSNKRKNPTISFRISDAERKQIEARIFASGMLKKDYFVRSCIYNRICVVGKKETVYSLIEALRELQLRTAAMQKAFLTCPLHNSDFNYIDSANDDFSYTDTADTKSDENAVSQTTLPSAEDIASLQEDYTNLLNAVIDLLDGARYLWEGGHCTNE